MKNMIRLIVIVSCLCLLALPLSVYAQRATSTAGSEGRAVASSSSSSGVATASSSTPSSSYSSRSDSGGYSGSSARASFGYSGSSDPGSGGGFVPSLRGTSFYSYSSFLRWQDFLYRLQLYYGFWFDNTRFMRNSEPLLTPRLASLAARRPLAASSELMRLVDELSSLLAEARSGKAIDKNAINVTAEQIRRLAKQIRSDEALSFVDRRNDIDLAKAGNFDQLGLDAIERLREVALDLNNQLKTLAEQSETSTVSVDYLSRPSFDSLTKGIDRLTRVIQNSARRL